MSTSELLNRLEEAAKPKIQWKSLSARDYELYSSVKESKAAASALNKAMREIAKEISKLVVKHPYDEKWWGRKIGELYQKHIGPVNKEYRDTGIEDTEPRYHIAQGIIDMVKGWYGIEGWTNLGDWI